MDKKIVSSLVKIANVLDDMGFYKDAKILDRIVISQNLNYSQAIEYYKKLVGNNDVQGATNYFNGVMRSNLTPQQKGAFRAQAERIRMEGMHGEYANYNPQDKLYNEDTLNSNLLKYGLQDPRINKIEFNKRWTNMMLNMQNEKDSTGRFWRDNPSWNKQMNLTYNMMTQRFK